MWHDLIQKTKDCGLDAIETYTFFKIVTSLNDENIIPLNVQILSNSFKLVQDVGLYVVMSIGTYVCVEWNYKDFPLQLHNMSGIQLQTTNQVYKNEMHIFTPKVVNMCKQVNPFAS